jgi:hypothetical protein
MSIKGVANTEYASLTGKIRTFVVDKTLTISGACADAKATGEAIEKNAGVAAEEYLNKALTPAVEAAMSGAYERLDVLDGQYKLEKIVDFTLLEDTKAGFYLELPKPLTDYPLLFFKALGAKCSNSAADIALSAVESTESKDVLYTPFTAGAAGQTNAGKDTLELSCPRSTWTDAKYLYVNTGINSYTIYAGLHIEIWGAVK